MMKNYLTRSARKIVISSKSKSVFKLALLSVLTLNIQTIAKAANDEMNPGVILNGAIHTNYLNRGNTLAFKPITGLITDETGSPLPGATVYVKGTTIKTVTGSDGKFVLNVPDNTQTLVVSYVGMESQEINISNSTNITVKLKPSADANLSEVVVTALGIERKAKSLTYSTQVVKGDELTKVKDANPMNNLTGKVSGLQINRSSSGIGGSVNITLRGLKSLRNNQPLYVIDGLPIVNVSGSGSTGPFGGSTDRGDILSTLNADDIVSINVLKGASASALYGSEGANGAIMITTKKGQSGSTKIDISSTTNLDKAFYLPELQFSYAQSPSATNTAEESWGDKGNFTNHVNDFFKTGVTLINSVGISGGNEKSQNNFSYANTINKGILPTSKFKQNTLSYRNTTKLLNDKLTFDGSIMYSDQDVENRPTSGLYYGSLAGLYMFPRGLDFNYYKDNYKYLSPTRNLELQNWFNINYDKGLSGTHHSQNPYWALYKDPTTQSRHNVIASVSLKYALTDWLALSTRGNLNKVWNKFERDVYAGTQGVISGQTSALTPLDNGRLIRDEDTGLNKYADVLLNGNKKLNENFELNFTAGASITDYKSISTNIDASILKSANAFLLSGISSEGNSFSSLKENFSRYQKQGIFASANLGYREYIYIDLTARNDWSSTLAFTPNEKSGYFYYSAGISLALNEMFKLPTWNTLSKLRFTYAKVGNDVAQYATNTPLLVFNYGNYLPQTAGVLPGQTLKPEISTSYELGYEGRFLNNRLGIDLALYKSNTVNQFVQFAGLSAQLNSTVLLNAGNVENKGIELAINYDVFKGSQFNWTSGLNFTANRNKVLVLAPGYPTTFPIGNFGALREGGSFGDFWGKTFLRDAQGRMVVADDGTPLGSVDGYIGNSNPKALIGWNNTFSYKDFSLSIGIDGRFGGSVISVTQGYLDSFGYSKKSADARDAKGVTVNAAKQDGTPVTTVPAQKYYQGVGNRDGIIEGLVYSATNVRLRELAIGYKVPIKSKVIKNANISLTGRNLFFFKNDAPYDPELNTATGSVSQTSSTGTNNIVSGQGFDSFGLPTTRSFGLNIKLSL